jgi:hypothetical protein
MLDFAVAAAVLFAGELPESATAARRQVKQLRAYSAAAGLVRRMSARDEYPPVGGAITAAARAAAGSEL